MKDREIKSRRAELRNRREKIVQEWKDYDKRFPVIPGAIKPADYDRQQMGFLDRLSSVDNEMAALPRTVVEKCCLGLILATTICGLGYLVYIIIF